jgi:hypothetical protein
VPSLTNKIDRDHHFEQLFEIVRECFIDPADTTPTSDLLDDHWLSLSDLAEHNLAQQQALACRMPSLGTPLATRPLHHTEGVPLPCPIPPPDHPLFDVHTLPSPAPKQEAPTVSEGVPPALSPAHPLAPP